MSKKLNGRAKWTIIIIFVAGVIFNTAILWNDVQHLKKQVTQVEKRVGEIYTFLIGEKD